MRKWRCAFVSEPFNHSVNVALQVKFNMVTTPISPEGLLKVCLAWLLGFFLTFFLNFNFCRLCSKKGVAALKNVCSDVTFKGKGHEVIIFKKKVFLKNSPLSKQLIGNLIFLSWFNWAELRFDKLPNSKEACFNCDITL